MNTTEPRLLRVEVVADLPVLWATRVASGRPAGIPPACGDLAAPLLRSRQRLESAFRAWLY